MNYTFAFHTQDPGQQLRVFDYQQKKAVVSVEFSVNDYVYSQVSMMLRGIPDSIVDRMFPHDSSALATKRPNKRWSKKELKFYDENIHTNPEQTETVSIFNCVQDFCLPVLAVCYSKFFGCHYSAFYRLQAASQHVVRIFLFSLFLQTVVKYFYLWVKKLLIVGSMNIAFSNGEIALKNLVLEIAKKKSLV